jgi:hypothetical protein
MSEGEGGNFGLWRPERGGGRTIQGCPKGGRGLFSISSVGGMDLFWNDPMCLQKFKRCLRAALARSRILSMPDFRQIVDHYSFHMRTAFKSHWESTHWGLNLWPQRWKASALTTWVGGFGRFLLVVSFRWLRLFCFRGFVSTFHLLVHAISTAVPQIQTAIYLCAHELHYC